jgi:hypothetical protein
MASTEGFEPATLRLEGACSIQLSYEDTVTLYTFLKEMARRKGLEPSTF